MSSEAWKKENTAVYCVRIMNSTGIPLAIEKAILEANSNKNAYIITAIREKLIRDGYLKESET